MSRYESFKKLSADSSFENVLRKPLIFQRTRCAEAIRQINHSKNLITFGRVNQQTPFKLVGRPRCVTARARRISYRYTVVRSPGAAGRLLFDGETLLHRCRRFMQVVIGYVGGRSDNEVKLFSNIWKEIPSPIRFAFHMTLSTCAFIRH